MRYLAAIAALSTALSGCATYERNQAQQAYNAKMINLKTWFDSQRPLVENGSKLRSQVFAEAYDKALAPPSGPNDLPAMRFAQHMIVTARELEAGKITKAQYDDDNRSQTTLLNEAIQQGRAQAEAEDYQRRQAAAAMFLQMRPRTTNCSGSYGYATCTTY